MEIETYQLKQKRSIYHQVLFWFFHFKFIPIIPQRILRIFNLSNFFINILDIFQFITPSINIFRHLSKFSRKILMNFHFRYRKEDKDHKKI
jgi:hypothetical protein